MSSHVVVAKMAEAPRVLRAVRQMMKERLGIEHVTVQIEDEALRIEEARLLV